MQQAQKGRDVNNLFIKILILLGIFILGGKAYGQNNDFAFQKNIIKVLKYPEGLKQSCTSTYTNILIEVNKDYSIRSLSVSDSAPQLFKDEFNKIKESLNLELLTPIIKDVKARYIILPVFYVYQSDYCVNSFEAAGYITDNYYSFNGRRVTTLVHNLKPIINIIYKPIH